MSQGIMNRKLFCWSCLSQVTGLRKGQARFFNNSGACKRAWVPKFKPTSSQSLDELLTIFREHVFVPASLKPHQRRLIFNEEATNLLHQNPITVTLHSNTGESYSLRPVKFNERPSNKVVEDIINLMREPKDWYSLVPLLKGLHSSKRTPNIRLWEFIVRKAGEAGMNSVIIDCAEEGRRTGFSLGDYLLAELFFSNLRLKAESAGFKGPELEKALRQAKHVAMLMNAEEHVPVDKTKPDPRQHPNIIAVLLELSAARVLDAFEGKDVQGDVRSYARKLLGTWVLREKFDTIKYPKKVVRHVTDLPSVRNGIELALQVEEIKKDEKLSEALRERLNELDTHVKEAEA
ncbi:hypothetical protein ACO22_01355 [Paracoccidioides brasiliensis]|uniref:Uncharacterized protein n=1 Tax=Paracoccidioides brasiliensis TaxID=121759 RepID=A0A1D2JLV3_PARBR|nr:hypothetical protein ACO22_01355 [Paracoccidioides brasiliensis]